MKRFILGLIFIVAFPVYGYDFKDLCRDIAPSDEASKAILNVLHSLENIEFDDKTQGFMDFMRNGMDTDSFYFGDLYRSQFFKPVDDGYRALTLKHIRNPGSNTISVTPECYNSVDVTNCKDYMGVQELGIKANTFATLRKYRSFSVYFKSKESWENAGDISPASIADGILKIVDPSNIRQMKPAASCAFYKDLKGETRVLMDDFSNTFPNLSSLVDRYVEINNFIAIETQKSGFMDKLKDKDGNVKKDVQFTHFQFEPEIKTKALKKDYPDLTDYMEKYRKLIKVDGVLRNKNGHIYGRLIITPKKTLIEGYTYDGKVIPFDENGKLIFEEAGTFETEKDIIADGNMEVDFLGLKLKLYGIGNIQHTTDKNGDVVKAKLSELKYEYSGRLLGFIPISVIKMVAPIDIDKFASDMIYVMLNANNGEGTVGSVEWVKDDARNRFSKIYVSTEMLDHYTIQFLARYSRIFIGSSESAVEESRKFSEQVLDAVIADAKAVFTGLEYDGLGIVQR